MRRINGRLIFLPSDLVTYSGRRSRLGWSARLDDPSLDDLIDAEDPLLASLAKQGYAHETSFHQSLARDGLPLFEVARADPAKMFAVTVHAVSEGCPAIAQGCLMRKEFAGITDSSRPIIISGGGNAPGSDGRAASLDECSRHRQIEIGLV